MARANSSNLAAPAWTFLTNHAHVILCLAGDPAMRIQDIADHVGITYRAVQRILDELQAAGYIERSRQKENARSNIYRVNKDLHLRHEIERHQTVAALIELASKPATSPND